MEKVATLQELRALGKTMAPKLFRLNKPLQMTSSPAFMVPAAQRSAQLGGLALPGGFRIPVPKALYSRAYRRRGLPQEGGYLQLKGQMGQHMANMFGTRIPQTMYQAANPQQKEYFNRLVAAHEGDLEHRAMQAIPRGTAFKNFYGHASPSVILGESDLVSRGGEDARLVRQLLGPEREENGADWIRQHIPGWQYGHPVSREMQDYAHQQWYKPPTWGQRFQDAHQQLMAPFRAAQRWLGTPLQREWKPAPMSPEESSTLRDSISKAYAPVAPSSFPEPPGTPYSGGPPKTGSDRMNSKTAFKLGFLVACAEARLDPRDLVGAADKIAGLGTVGSLASLAAMGSVAAPLGLGHTAGILAENGLSADLEGTPEMRKRYLIRQLQNLVAAEQAKSQNRLISKALQ